MKTNLLALAAALLLTCCSACRKDLVEYERGDLKVCIEPGGEWLHDFPVMLGIKKKNPPQIAVWAEDTAGNYVATWYVTYKAATQSWQSAGGNRRKEALPHWCHARGVLYDDGLYLPTKKQPLTDGLSGATPRSSFEIKVHPEKAAPQPFVLKVEINHSADFNASYPESARQGEPGYSGGKEGSGQPAVVYAALIDLSTGRTTFEAVLAGHSSPDGSAGYLDPDISGLTTALHIVKRITLHIREE